MHPLVIQRPFPAEHPFSSHIPRFAIFPTFESPSDPKKGVEARDKKPKDATMPSHPYDFIVLGQTKGSPFRHELQLIPPESEKVPLNWKSHDFDQFPKSPWNEKQDFYPLPPKLFVPGHKKRSNGNCIRGNMEVSMATADTMKNVERNQWKTTYDLSHTGLGETNPLTLDNYSSKPDNDDSLKPRSVPTFDPPRPVEGRIARSLVPSPPSQTDKYPDPPKNKDYIRKMSLHEIEEDRLWNGKEHANFPETQQRGKDSLWKEQQTSSHHDTGLVALASAQSSGQATHVPHKPLQGPATYPTGGEELDELLSEQHLKHQQIEASNRFALLEGMTPDKDLTSLHHKLDITNTKTQPYAFYNHEGKYQEERAGLYKTSYDPAIFKDNMDKRSGSQAVDVTNYQKDSLNLPVALNEEVAQDLRFSRTIGGPPASVDQLHGQPSQYEVFAPFEATKAQQRAKIQPNSSTAGIRVQEGGVVLRESTQGESYNTEKFLQKNKLSEHARNEPNTLISNDNQNLLKVYPTSAPNDGVPGIRRTPMPYERELPNMERPGSTPIGFRDRYSYQGYDSSPQKCLGLPTRSQSFIRPEQLVSKSSNFAGTNALSGVGPLAHSLDLSFKNDAHFQWKPGCGTPRPQTILLDIQNSFTKSDARKKFHQKFQESLPDLRENIVAGKKHVFGAFNAQVLRGTPIVPVQ